MRADVKEKWLSVLRRKTIERCERRLRKRAPCRPEWPQRQWSAGSFDAFSAWGILCELYRRDNPESGCYWAQDDWTRGGCYINFHVPVIGPRTFVVHRSFAPRVVCDWAQVPDRLWVGDDEIAEVRLDVAADFIERTL